MLPTAIDFLRHSFQFAALYTQSEDMTPLPEMLYESREEQGNDTVLHQRFDTMLFAQACSILDRAVIDYQSIEFLGSQLAAGVFWKTYGLENPVEIREKILAVATGYSLDQLKDCLEFLEPYGSPTFAEYTEILQGEVMVEVIQKHAVDMQYFRLEEHQTPCVMSPADYDHILATRAQRAGKAHVMSHWQFE